MRPSVGTSSFSRVPQLASELGLESCSLDSLARSLPFHHEGATLGFQTDDPKE